MRLKDGIAAWHITLAAIAILWLIEFYFLVRP